MIASLVRRYQAALLGLMMLVGLGVAVLAPSSPAYADGPACKNGGVYILFARGSGAPFNSGEATSFKTAIEYRLGSIPSTWAELGRLDADPAIDSDDYPAVPVDWEILAGYSPSVTIGANELVAHLNARVIQCTNEAIVLGGYSQGADVIGWALERTGGGGYGALSATAKSRIAYVALYGDPKFNAGNPFERQSGRAPWWVRGDARGYIDISGMPSDQNGLLGARNPYAPAEFQGRMGSWCDQSDGVCTDSDPGSHTSAYTGRWIVESAPEIANKAWLKTIELNPQPATPPPPNVNPAPGAGQKLAATKNQDGRLGLFYVGGDSAIYYQYQLNPGGYWGSEKRIAAYAKGIAATTSLDSRIELFYIGGDNAIYHRYQTVANSDSWSAEERFNVGALGISAARNGAGRIELVIIGMNRALYIAEQQAPNSWSNGAMNGSEWQHIPSWAGDVAMTTASDGRNEIFYVGSTGVMMHRWQGAVGDSYPHEEGFSANIVKIAATRNQDGRLEVFSVGTNAHLYNKWQWQPNTPWYHTWDQRVGQARYLTAARNHDGRLELFHVGLNNRIYHQWQNNPGAGQGWSTESLMYGSAAP